MSNKELVDKLIEAADYINKINRQGSGNYTVMDSRIAKFLIKINRIDKIKRIKIKLNEKNKLVSKKKLVRLLIPLSKISRQRLWHIVDSLDTFEKCKIKSGNPLLVIRDKEIGLAYIDYK